MRLIGSPLVLAVIATVLSGCATRTLYGPDGEQGGYSESMISNKVMVARFRGNAYTNKQDVQYLSILRAIEICTDQNAIPRVIGQQDRSTSQTVQKTSNYVYQTPTYVNAYANTQANTSYMGGGNFLTNANTSANATVTGGDQYGMQQTWNETYVFPTYDTAFICQRKPRMLGVSLKDVSSDDMKPFVKDLLGATQVMDFTPETSNKGVLEIGDLITKLGDQRIQNQFDLITALDKLESERVSITVIRKSKSKKLEVRAVDVSEELKSNDNKLLTAYCHLPEISKRPVCAGYVRAPASNPWQK